MGLLLATSLVPLTGFHFNSLPKSAVQTPLTHTKHQPTDPQSPPTYPNLYPIPYPNLYPNLYPKLYPNLYAQPTIPVLLSPTSLSNCPVHPPAHLLSQPPNLPSSPTHVPTLPTHLPLHCPNPVYRSAPPLSSPCPPTYQCPDSTYLPTCPTTCPNPNSHTCPTTCPDPIKPTCPSHVPTLPTHLPLPVLTLSTHLPLQVLTPVNPVRHNDSRSNRGLLVQVPPFWQGLLAQGPVTDNNLPVQMSKCVTYIQHSCAQSEDNPSRSLPPLKISIGLERLIRDTVSNVEVRT